MTEIKITLDAGPLKVHYEGSAEFAKDELPDLMERFVGMNIPNIAPTEGQSQEKSPDDLRAKITSNQKLSTTDYAARMGAKSGTDLAIAAVAHLHLTRGLEEFRRQEILSEMKSAKSFYKPSYSSNFSKSLETLVKTGRLMTPKQDTYTPSYSEVEKIKMLL